MKILIDMNLSPDWAEEFKKNQIVALHWSEVGSFYAPDIELMTWAKQNDYILFTHDLDFGTILALTGAEKPSVIQIRAQDVSTKYLGKTVIATLKKYQDYLDKGALIVLDDNKERLRILPLN